MSILSKTQAVRERIIDELTKDESGIPVTDSDMGILLEVMRDADRTALTQIKIAVDDKNSENDRALAVALANVANQRDGANPFERVIQGEVVVITKALAKEEQLPNVTIQPGQCDVGVASETYDDFIVRTEGPATA